MPRGNQRMPGVCQVAAPVSIAARTQAQIAPENMSSICWTDGSKSGSNLKSTRIPNNTLTFHLTRDPSLVRPHFHTSTVATAGGYHPLAPCTLCTPLAAEPQAVGNQNRGWEEAEAETGANFLSPIRPFFIHCIPCSCLTFWKRVIECQTWNFPVWYSVV